MLEFLYAQIFITLAAFFKAVVNTLDHHFDSSVFRKWNTPFWNPLHPDNDKVKMIFRYPLDGWHITNSLMIVCFIGAGLFNTWLVWYWELILMGLTFNGVFNLFYNKILR